MRTHKKLHYIGLLALSISLFSCGGGDDDDGGNSSQTSNSNEAPSVIQTNQVLFPTPNLLCIDNNIAFDWEDATSPDGGLVSYRILIARDRDLTMVEEIRTVTSSNVTIALEIGTAFYWNITSISSQGVQSDPSETLAFFTMGEGAVNNVPFTAAVVSPLDNATGVAIDAAGMTSLTWDGADTDTSDTLSYELFFGTTNPPASFQTDLTAETADVPTTAATTYFWSVNTTDNSGATSVGRVFQFTTN